MFAPVMRIVREVKRCVGGGGLWKYWENISLRTDIMGGVFGGDGSDVSACGICGCVMLDIQSMGVCAASTLKTAHVKTFATSFPVKQSVLYSSNSIPLRCCRKSP